MKATTSGKHRGRPSAREEPNETPATVAKDFLRADPPRRRHHRAATFCPRGPNRDGHDGDQTGTAQGFPTLLLAGRYRMSTTIETNVDLALWTVADVASFLRVSKSWVYQASTAGTLPCIHIGALLRFDPAGIRAWARGESGGKVVQLRGCRG